MKPLTVHRRIDGDLKRADRQRSSIIVTLREVESKERTLPGITEARGADQLFASAMTTLDTRTTPPWWLWRAFHSQLVYCQRIRWLTSSLVRPECIILLRRVILQSFREYPHGLSEKKCRDRTSCYASREKWPSLLNMSRAAVTTGGGKGRPMHFPLERNHVDGIGRFHPTWRQRHQSRLVQPLFTRFPLDRYFWEGTNRRRS